jgi:hypothetical protein
MGLPASQRRVLDRIEGTLGGADPQLAAMFAIFGRLNRDEEMPRVEELRRRAAVPARRHRGRRPARRRRSRTRLSTRRWATVFFPVALVLTTLAIVVVARFGATSRCAPITAVATAKPNPRGKLPQVSRLCPRGLQNPRGVQNPLLLGR